MNCKAIFEKIQSWQSSQWIIFAAMVIALVLKSTIWHVQMFMDWDVRLHYLLYTAVWFSLWVLACKKRPWWTLSIFLIANLWMFSCYVYYKVWGVMVTMNEVRILDNLKGFESSIFADWKWSMLLWIALPDALYIAVLCWMRPAKKSLWKQMLIVMGIGILTIPAHQWEFYKKMYPQQHAYNYFEPGGFQYFWYENAPLFYIFYQPYEEARMAFLNQSSTEWEIPHVHFYGIMDYGIAMVIYDQYYSKSLKEMVNEPVELTEEEEEIIGMLYHPENEDFVSQRSLILILVESFEPWAIDAKGKDGSWVMPNLRKFMDENNTFFAPKMETMTLRGGSSDGQLMTLTGLAPASNGVTVALHGDQPFPNFAHYYPRSRTLNPSPGTWKQPIVNPHYGIKELEESDSIGSDEGLFHRLSHISMDSISFTFLITVSTHVPFSMADNVDFEMDPDMPEKASRYLKCVHYFDQQLGTLLNKVKSSPVLRNCDIVITADHSIMFAPDIKEIQTFAEKSGMATTYLEACMIPLIMYSPTLTESTIYDQRCYQVDIYPSILGLIGCKNPKWEGTGMNLLDTIPRRLETEQVYSLSDKLIRGHYFSSH